MDEEIKTFPRVVFSNFWHAHESQDLHNADSDSECLGWDLWFFISNEFPHDPCHVLRRKFLRNKVVATSKQIKIGQAS